VFLAQQDFWASVPKSDDLMGVGLDWEAEGSCKTEISELTGSSIVTDQQILRFEISVENSVLMEEDQRLANLIQKALSLCWWESSTLLLHELFKIKLKVFKNEI